MENITDGYEKLENSLMDIVKEEQAKLGYRKEKIRLYYPLSSLNHIFNSNMDVDAMKENLRGYGKRTKHLGDVKVSNEGERFCFNIPEDGVEYVYENTPVNEFIKELVTLIGKHGCTLEEVFELFKSKNSNVKIEKTYNGEFDYLIRFGQYYYCFKDEGCHIIYHRFTPEDYNDFEF